MRGLFKVLEASSLAEDEELPDSLSDSEELELESEVLSSSDSLEAEEKVFSELRDDTPFAADLDLDLALPDETLVSLSDSEESELESLSLSLEESLQEELLQEPLQWEVLNERGLVGSFRPIQGGAQGA